jgi:hypothetical protein
MRRSVRSISFRKIMQVTILLIPRCPPLAAGLEGRPHLDAEKRKSWMAGTRPAMTIEETGSRRRTTSVFRDTR